MTLNYLHLSLDHPLPSAEVRPYRAVLISEQSVSEVWRNEVASWLLESGCLYFIAWGIDCEAWHDTVDWANLKAFDFGEIPDDRFVMTTWHDKEPLSEALWFAGNCASHPDIELLDTVIVHVAREERRVATLELYDESQTMVDET
ncbi:hypothetical protein ASE85_07875 [Sphingobium sp. Leaf26]|uniref:DUF7684 family protein n=1 Tax=Sphingobium sp. Leaf26 TaxID=1735693 RepID=UPI000701C3D1|nr:hypothetical protein [Sphingobium sp. Leaf26]KQN04893.1 hypothetical protein ASE85_07875 [Sphingobium sp. Leaf26]